VYSTQAGTVVYAGNGLVGYGNLVIIKHNARYLSAYAHNSRILVSEGQRVRAGMKVAEMGSSGTSRPMLHFEIRREGKPVDPMVLLPLRR
jgi:lipoprotein NlpD